MHLRKVFEEYAYDIKVLLVDRDCVDLLHVFTTVGEAYRPNWISALPPPGIVSDMLVVHLAYVELLLHGRHYCSFAPAVAALFYFIFSAAVPCPSFLLLAAVPCSFLFFF